MNTDFQERQPLFRRQATIDDRQGSAIWLLRPGLIGWGHNPSSVCQSVCLVPDPKSKMKGHNKLKIGRKEAHDSGDPWSHLEVERSKIKVTRPINTVTDKPWCSRTTLKRWMSCSGDYRKKDMSARGRRRDSDTCRLRTSSVRLHIKHRVRRPGRRHRRLSVARTRSSRAAYQLHHPQLSRSVDQSTNGRRKKSHDGTNDV